MELREVNKKVVLLGDGKVGKTAIVDRFVNDRFTESYTPGTGMKVYQKNLQFVYPNLIVNLKMQICDLCGQREYARIRESALTGASGVMIVGDLTRPETISSINEFWFKEVKTSMGGLPTAYLGNKIDLVSEDGPSAKLLQRAGDNSGAIVFLSSAKTGENIEEMFLTFGKHLITDIIHQSQRSQMDKPSNLMGAFDYIVQDFCAQHGDLEKAMLIAQNQFLEAGLDMGNPKKEVVLDVLKRFMMVERILLSDTIAKANFDERVALVESVCA